MNKFELNLFAYENALIILDDLLMDMDNHYSNSFEAINDDYYDAASSSNPVLN